MNNKYLTKSKFKIGLECPRKLYYYEHPDIYQNEKLDDPFLEALAHGGFQVGALAKIYHPDGIDLSELSTEQAITKTNELLRNEVVTIFEAAIYIDSLLIKVDILEKSGKAINLYEVKSKSFNSLEDTFFKKTGDLGILAKWEKYLFDIAYQTYVSQKYNPEFVINPFLTLVNKNAIASVDGLNQNFRLTELNNGHKKVIVKAGTDHDTVGERILINVDASAAVNLILNKVPTISNKNIAGQVSFEDVVSTFLDGIQNDNRLQPKLDGACQKCEFRCESTTPQISGFDVCWGPKYKSSDDFVFDVWYLNPDKIMATGRVLMSEIVADDFKLQDTDEAGLLRQDRQWLQADLTTKKTKTPYINKNKIAQEMKSWKFPLHFIDFETCRVAIPFNKGLRPYEQIAFQFSHHIVKEDGTIEHFGEYINIEPGIFPNFDFVRALKAQLDQDNGTIFRYSNHENTVLCEIATQLMQSNETDKNELIEWIKSVTTKKNGWTGVRSMVDLLDLIIKYYYHPLMKGSNSLKIVLPTILTLSKYLQDKYSNPIYGSENGLKSINFNNKSWVQYNADRGVIDPYDLLPELFKNMDKKLDNFFDEDELKDGGAAMTAYSKLQFTEMSDDERIELRNALLKYCELDTFAMVLLYEHLSDSVQS